MVAEACDCSLKGSQKAEQHKKKELGAEHNKSKKLL
jgi:hypothetical protein